MTNLAANVPPEPRYSIRFVEKKAGETKTQEIVKMPAIVGHEGSIVPLLCNGMISKKHCTVSYDLNTGVYSVTDGAGDKPSTNHIYFGDRKSVSVVSTIELTELGQIVYLLRMINGTEAYVELYDPNSKYNLDPRSTQSMDPKLVKTAEIANKAKALAEEANVIAVENRDYINELDGRLKPILIIVDYVGQHPRRVAASMLILLPTIVILTVIAIAWSGKDSFGDLMIERYRESNQQHRQYRPEGSSTTPPPP